MIFIKISLEFIPIYLLKHAKKETYQSILRRLTILKVDLTHFLKTWGQIKSNLSNIWELEQTKEDILLTNTDVQRKLLSGEQDSQLMIKMLTKLWILCMFQQPRYMIPKDKSDKKVADSQKNFLQSNVKIKGYFPIEVLDTKVRLMETDFQLEKQIYYRQIGIILRISEKTRIISLE
ncbi:unnamed protein product (macronuclear) [Paramecium tetraurelia]|uniref:Uncharacterized protein n=1 Tax=Paramecium tetraurelia TaxID=5888 RepID=A0CLQ0_PARTE|nr:uncharacterized protein GSPATT00038642001 [Paramecium tetraurelia]CAK71717.1 unnamed protein product [Paramecium tetraurelia]|eukprot:XP_001439114.1 hypothetical protein (macronuclear) [Paramecium tetraurelia strain d4-2]